MTDLERRAMLGDAEAQRECTEKGIALCRSVRMGAAVGNGAACRRKDEN